METERSRILYSESGKRLQPPAIMELMVTALASKNVLSLAAGFTDNETLPRAAVREIADQLLSDPERAETLQYGTNQGRPLLRKLLAKRISKQDRLSENSNLDPDQFLITNGSQQALALAAQVLCDPGDIVFVENPTYFVFLDVLRGVGADIRDLPRTSENRIDADAFGKKLDELSSDERKRVKAVYLLGYFSNPASTTLTEREKNDLAAVLESRGLLIPIIEDAAYRDLYFDRLPESRSVLALESFQNFPRLYLGTLTKSFASGLKTGFVCCTDLDWLRRMLYLKGQHDFGTANFLQSILEEVLNSGRFEEQLATLRKTYRGKMQVLHETLQKEQIEKSGWSWEIPEGGLYLWLEGPGDLDLDADSDFCRRAIENGVLYVPGDLCMGESRRSNFIRLSFASLSHPELKEAGKRFAKTVREFANRAG